MRNDIKLSAKRKEEVIKSIIQYFYRERGEDIGILAAELFYDFIMKEVGTELYNQGLIDAKEFVEEKIDDIYGLMK